MEAATLQNRVKDVIAEVGGISDAARDNLTGETTLEGVGFDSLDRVELCNAIEDTFGILPTEKESQEWQTVGDVIQYVKTLAK